MTSGALVHIISAAIRLSAVVLASPTLYDVIRFAGAAYLAWVGFKFMTSGPSLLSIDPAKSRPLCAFYLQGVMTNLLNPKAALFKLSFVSQFASPDIGMWSQMLILGFLNAAIMILVELPIVLASGWFAAALVRQKGAGLWLIRLIGAFLIGLALILPLS